MNNSTPHSTNNNAPVQLGHYLLRDCIGRGGMGLVYRARDMRLERDVAVKCLRTELFEAHYIERFKREALLLAKLNHPNIVQIYDFIEAPEQVALVMELVDGQNLQLYLREHLVSITQRLQWLVQISEGLAVAHDAGIIHRDLKTENILINKRGQAKITDLGIAKSQDFNATITDHVAGSYCSMSPEQAMGEAITFKSDLFSLGILAYQLLCGAHPFGDTSNKLQTMQRIISHPPTAPQKHNPDLPIEFVELLGQLLSKDPDKRPDNTHWVAAQFTKLKELTWHDDLLSDDTQALAIPLSPNTKAVRTQDHPTFETRFIAAAIVPKISIWQKIKSYVAANKIIVSSAAASFLIIAGIVVWQLQPKPPKYVAVIPPKLTAEGMQESQQELVKGAVYDAIQQSVIQLDGYYLIPSNDIADVNGDTETIQRATAADELITTEIQCKIETCSIKLLRLSSHEAKDGRLRIENATTIDVLTDNYLPIAEAAQNQISYLYSKSVTNSFDDIEESAYKNLLYINQSYRSQGAHPDLLAKLDNTEKAIKKMSIAETLYKDVALDLYHENNNPKYIKNLEEYLGANKENKKKPNHINNLFYLYIAQKDFQKAKSSIEELVSLNINKPLVNELLAYSFIAQNDYIKAAAYFEKSLQSKHTTKTLINLANAYWYSGDTKKSRRLLDEAIKLSPNNYKAHSLHGIISLTDGDIVSAKDSFEKITNHNPNDASNLNNLGLCLLLMKNFAEAKEIFNRVSDLAPYNSTYNLNKADAEYFAGDIEKSNLTYQKIVDSIDENTQESTDLRSLAQAHAHLKNFSVALRILQRLERIDSQNIETNYTLALVHTLANNTTSAIFYIENVLKSGMHFSWFSFNWFDSLCQDEKFNTIMKTYGEQARCSP